jgi:predicted flap endonuclease-1-like 5' DNA nuclease
MSDPSREPRQTLALRLAERNRQRALRAERLARLRPAAPAAGADAAAAAMDDPETDAAEAALEAFLRALAGDRPPAPADLDRLPGAGPGLIWALERAGLRRLADLAPLAPGELAARLGPLGRLVPAQAWIELARGAGPA